MPTAYIENETYELKKDHYTEDEGVSISHQMSEVQRKSLQSKYAHKDIVRIPKDNLVFSSRVINLNLPLHS